MFTLIPSSLSRKNMGEKEKEMLKELKKPKPPHSTSKDGFTFCASKFLIKCWNFCLNDI